MNRLCTVVERFSENAVGQRLLFCHILIDGALAILARRRYHSTVLFNILRSAIYSSISKRRNLAVPISVTGVSRRAPFPYGGIRLGAPILCVVCARR